jgi:hypothetical protein
VLELQGLGAPRAHGRRMPIHITDRTVGGERASRLVMTGLGAVVAEDLWLRRLRFPIAQICLRRAPRRQRRCRRGRGGRRQRGGGRLLLFGGSRRRSTTVATTRVAPAIVVSLAARRVALCHPTAVGLRLPR